MIDKTSYVERFKKLYEEKNNENISEDEALEYFEKLVVLVNVVHKKII